MLDKNIKFDESYINKEYDSITLYFIAPKELFNPIDIDEETESVEISVECPREYISANYASVEYSPTKYNVEEECYIDYDWRVVDLPYEEIEALIKLAEESGRI